MKSEFPPLLGLDRLKIFEEKNLIFKKIISRKNFFFHIVGTNGKGSLSSGIAQNLRFQGKKIGLFTSPHLVDVNERIRINGVPIEGKKLNRLMAEFSELSYFEAIFASAIIHFEHCDYVVLEAGLGGRFDATNIIHEPLFVGITSISLDHEQLLGETVEKIAIEKIQVVKNCLSVFAYEEDKKILEPLLPSVGYVSSLKEFIKKALSCANIYVSSNDIGLPIWPGRFHFLRNILVDGCHNPEGVEYFLDKLKQDKISVSAIAFCGLADKKPEILIKKLESLEITIHVIPELSERSLTKEEGENLLKLIGLSVRGEVLSLEKFIQICDANKDKNFAFVGSLYGLGALFNVLQISPWCP